MELILIVVVVSTIWVWADASGRDWSATGGSTVGWVLGCLFLWIVFFPLYLARRNLVGPAKTQKPPNH
jgi:hypothetical protein